MVVLNDCLELLKRLFRLFLDGLMVVYLALLSPVLWADLGLFMACSKDCVKDCLD